MLHVLLAVINDHFLMRINARKLQVINNSNTRDNRQSVNKLTHLKFSNNLTHKLLVGYPQKVRWLSAAVAVGDEKNLQTIAEYNTAVAVAGQTPPPTLWEAICQFVAIWPPGQWISSLVVLIIMYIIASKLHNKYIAPHIGLYFNNWGTACLIGSDLMLNFIVGIYYMYHRDTLMGQFMLQCPVAISPAIFVSEIIVVTIWYLIEKKWKTMK